MLNVKLPIPPMQSMLGFGVYRQYQFDDVISRVFEKTKEFYYNLYVSTLEEGLREQCWNTKSNNEYICFYYDSLYGFKRPYGKTGLLNQWDKNKKMDSGLKWDEINAGYISIPLFRIAVKYLFSYKQNSFTLVWLWNFVREFCGTTDFNFSFSGSGIIVNIPTSIESNMLNTIFSVSLYNKNLPLTPIQFNLT